MERSEFWLNQVVEFVRKLKQDCERCQDCGALACGKKHANWHTQLDNKVSNAQAAIQDLRTRMTAAETEIASLKTRVTALGG